MQKHTEFLDKVERRDYTLLPEYWSWMFAPINGGNMKRVNLPTFYTFGRIMSELRIIDSRDSLGDRGVMRVVFAAHIWLQFVLAEIKNVSMPNTRDIAKGLSDLLGEYGPRVEKAFKANTNETLGDIFVKRVNEELDELETVFKRESKRVSIFAVTPKGIYDNEKLIESAEKRFPENLLAVMPQLTIDDIREAGKCLAFELPTACAFHVCRATEGLMLTYYEALKNQAWPFKKRDWNIYNDQLASNGAPKSITNRLAEIRDDRNAYAHPDITVPLDEAPIVFELCNNVIHLMAKEIERIKPATTITTTEGEQ